MNTCPSKYLNICLSVACCGRSLGVAEQLDIVMISTPLIIRVIFSLTQLARVFAVSGNGEWLLLASQSCSGSHISDIAPRGLSRGHHHCSRRQEERHLFLLMVNANKVLLPNVGLCEHCCM